MVDKPDCIEWYSDEEPTAVEHPKAGFLAVAVHTHQLGFHVTARHQQPE